MLKPVEDVWPYDTSEFSSIYQKKSANNGATQTYPFLKRRMKQHMRYDITRFLQLVARLAQEIEHERRFAPMSDDELLQRVEEKTGKADKSNGRR